MNNNKHIWVLSGSIIIAAIAFGWGIKDFEKSSFNEKIKLASLDQGSCCFGKSCDIPGFSSLAQLTSTSDLQGMLKGMCQKACGIKHYGENEVVMPALAKVGDITKCPVSGAVFQVKESSPMITFNGEEYYTCCSTCASLYDKQPEFFDVGD